MEADCPPLAEILAQLQEVSGDAPFLALGQTVFWDEPMKAGVFLASRRAGYARKLVAGVHDTDYFAKLPSGPRKPGKFKALPHNDTTTKGLWSAAAEFSELFGSETVITREALATAGLRVDRLSQSRPHFLDEATEAWGWKGVVSLDEFAPVTAEVPLTHLFTELKSTLDWALDGSLDSMTGEGRVMAERLADELRAFVCDTADDRSQSLSDYYRKLLPFMYEYCANAPVPLDTTSTTELLRFNNSTWNTPRFEMLDLFVNHETRAMARASYDEAIRGSSGLYELARFGTGAIPFDLVIPGLGRGTIRLGTKGAVISTHEPQFLTLKKPLTGVKDLAELIEAKFGPNCVIVGKAVALIGMLAREFVFVFHEGASSYVKHSRKLHQLLAANGHDLAMNPILRIRYDAWAALRVCCSWLKLPEPFHRAFGTEELCAPSFAGRWKEVAKEQEAVLDRLGSLRRPIELIRHFDEALGGSWQSLAREYEGLHAQLEKLKNSVETVRAERHAIVAEMRAQRAERQLAERAKGEHFRARIFEKTPSEEDLAERERLTHVVEAIIHRRTELQKELHLSQKKQTALVRDPEVLKIHERRRAIELEAELKRLRLIRQAIIVARGLDKANHRPSAWWFRLVCPDGLWFRETVDSAQYYLEPLR